MSNDPQARLRGAETTYRPMHAGDLAAVHRLAQQMSWPHRPEDCAQMLQLGSGVVAVDAVGATIGVGMRWRFGDGVGTIGMILVERERQGRGIGRALMTSLIAGSGARALMLNATAEGLGLYEKLGFVPAGAVHQHQGRVGESPVLPAAPSVPLRPAVPADHAALYALDEAAFGADRSALIRRLLANGVAWLVDGAAAAAGFASLRPFGRGMMIGPVVAPGEDEAIALVAAAASAAPPGVLRIDITARAAHLGAWLTAAGLPAIDTVTTMLRGDWPAQPKEPQRFGLALQALG